MPDFNHKNNDLDYAKFVMGKLDSQGDTGAFCLYMAICDYAKHSPDMYLSDFILSMKKTMPKMDVVYDSMLIQFQKNKNSKN